MRPIYLVPAKGQSERLPGKNLLKVGGKTLVERAMMSCPPDSTIIVCTDSEQVLTHAKVTMWKPANAEVIVHWLTSDLTSKRAHIEPVIADVLALRSASVAVADSVVLLQPTSPLRQRRHVASAVAMLARYGCDSVVSITDGTKQCYFGGRYFQETDEWIPGRDLAERLFTSELERNHHENGAVYAFTRKHFERTGSRMGGNMRAFTMEAKYSIDIDTPADLEMAQLMAGDHGADLT